MLIIGCDYHPGFQQIAFVDRKTGEYGERRLSHRQEAEQFYRELKARGLSVRVGMESRTRALVRAFAARTRVGVVGRGRSRDSHPAKYEDLAVSRTPTEQISSLKHEPRAAAEVDSLCSQLGVHESGLSYASCSKAGMSWLTSCCVSFAAAKVSAVPRVFAVAKLANIDNNNRSKKFLFMRLIFSRALFSRECKY